MPRTVNSGSDQTIPAQSAAAVVKSDATVLDATRGLWVGGVGDVAVTMANGETPITFVGVAAGTLLPISVTKVLAATTATSILALY